MELGGGCGLFQDSFHPLEALLDLIDRVGVRQPQVPRSRLTKGRTGEHGDTALEQHAVGQLTFVLAGPRNVRKDVEGAQWFMAVNAGQLVQAIDYEVAAPLELRDH